MSTDIEKYAQIYGDLGDKDIEHLLIHAATLSRERGRPEVMFLNTNSERFREQQEYIEQEVQRRKDVQRHIVDFFRVRAPVGGRVALETLTPDFNHEIGSSLPNDIQTSYLLLPHSARHVAQTDMEEAFLLEHARTISPRLKIQYNHNIRAAMRASLLQVGDIRNILTLPPELLSARGLGTKRIAFLQQAFTQT